MNKSLLASVALVLSTSGVLAGGIVNGTLSQSGGIGSILVSNIITGNGAGLTNINGLPYNQVSVGNITVGNTYYPCLDAAISANLASGSTIPILCSAGVFRTTNVASPNFLISGAGPSLTFFEFHTTNIGSSFIIPNWCMPTNGQSLQVANCSCYGVFDYGSVATNGYNPGFALFGWNPYAAITNGAIYGYSSFNNVNATNNGSDIFYAPNTSPVTHRAPYPGFFCGMTNCTWAGRWDDWATSETNSSLNALGCSFSGIAGSPNDVGTNGVGNGAQSGFATAVNVGQGGFSGYFENCSFTALNSNSFAISSLAFNANTASRFVFVNCNITNSIYQVGGGIYGPTNYFQLGVAGTHTNYVLLVYSTGNAYQINTNGLFGAYGNEGFISIVTNFQRNAGIQTTASSSGSTQNALAGTIVFSAGQQTYLLTNLLVTYQSQIQATIGTPDITATSIAGATAANPVTATATAGLITFKMNAAATGTPTINWQIMNPWYNIGPY